MLAILASVAIVVSAGLIAMGPIHSSYARSDRAYNKNIRTETAYIQATGQTTSDRNGDPTEEQVKLRYRQFDGGWRITRVLWFPAGFEKGDPEYVQVQRGGVLFASDDLDFNASQWLYHDSAGQVGLVGWIVGAGAGLVVSIVLMLSLHLRRWDRNHQRKIQCFNRHMQRLIDLHL